MKPRVIGIMGGVASGKSMVAEMLGSLGAEVIHADEMAHELLEKPEIKEKVLERWGKGLLGGEGKERRWKIGQFLFPQGGGPEKTDQSTPPANPGVHPEACP